MEDTQIDGATNALGAQAIQEVYAMLMSKPPLPRPSGMVQRWRFPGPGST